MDEEVWRNLIKIPYSGSFAWIRDRRYAFLRYPLCADQRRAEDAPIAAKTVRFRRYDRRSMALLPRRIAVCAPLVEGAVYGTQMVGKRRATFDRRHPGGVTVSVLPDHRLERRHNGPLMPRWSASARAWVPVLCPRRRKGEERRDKHYTGFQYTKSRDPRIRALERRLS